MRFLTSFMAAAVALLTALAAPGDAAAQASGESHAPRGRATDRRPPRDEPPAEAVDVVETPAPRKITRGREKSSSDSAGQTRPTGAGWGVVGPLALVLVAALLGATLWKRHGGGLTPGLPREALDVLGRRALDQRTTLWLVRLGSRILVLGVTPGGVESLGEVTQPAEVDLLTGLCRRRGPGEKPLESFQSLFGLLSTGPKPGREPVVAHDTVPAGFAADGMMPDDEHLVRDDDAHDHPVHDHAGRDHAAGRTLDPFARRLQRSATTHDAEDFHGA